MVSLMLTEWWKMLLIGMEAVERKVANHLPVFILGVLRVCWARQGRVEGSAMIGRSLNTCNPLAPGIVWSRWQLK